MAAHSSEVTIHPTAIVERGAELAPGVTVGPWAYVGPRVRCGEGVSIAHHGVVEGRTVLGPRCQVHPFATVGITPQDKKYEGEESELVCGADNIFREYSNVSTGTALGGNVTRIGDGNLFMVYSHVAHDCIIGDRCVIANGVSLAGHITVGDRAVLGGHAAIHQFCQIGSYALLAGGAIVVQDVPPFVTVHGNHASPAGINVIGLQRAGFGKMAIRMIRTMYKLVFSSSLRLEEAVAKIRSDLEPSAEREQFLEFIAGSSRGLAR